MLAADKERSSLLEEAETVLGLRRPVTKISLYASKPAPFGHAYEILFEADLTGAA